jgi:hypothetical protein
MAEDVDWISLAADRHRWVDVVKKKCWFRRMQCLSVLGDELSACRDGLHTAVSWPNHLICTSTCGQAFAGGPLLVCFNR